MNRKIFRSKHRIGVIGTRYSGKTVFITSLISHIKNHNPEILRLKSGNTRIIFDTEHPAEKGFEKFEYTKHLAKAIDHRCWPDQTEKTSQFRCSFFRTDWLWTIGELSISDIPGERLCDILMARMDYAQWCDWLLGFMDADQEHEYQKLYKEYEGFLDSLGDKPLDQTLLEETKNQIIQRYSALLVGLCLGYRPIVTPSTFILSTDGKHLGEFIDNKDFSQCHPGLDAQQVFAPLPSKFRENNPVLAKVFTQHYKAYQNKIAIPLLNLFSSCNELVILVDITTLLNGNTAMYNGNRELVERIVECLSPGDGLFGNIGRLLSKFFGGHFGLGGIQRLAFVAPKADLVHKNDRPKLKALLEQMTKGFIDRLLQIKVKLACEYFASAAVKAAECLPDGKIKGYTNQDHPVLFESSPSNVPDEWPHSWNLGDHRFHSVGPKFPKNIGIPPPHINMDAIIDFLLAPID